MPSLRISEIFTSLQGEGRWVGVPSVFVRTSGCNLRCVWCDTPYASWDPEGPVRPVAEIADELIGTGVRHVVVTGGEPMLFEGTTELCQRLHQAGRIITIETAGTVDRELPCDLMSISPKLANSTPLGAEGGWEARHEARRWRPQVVAALIARHDYQLKFVVDPDAGEPGAVPPDLREIERFLAELGHHDPERVLLMAEGRDRETQLRRMRALVPHVIARGWRMTPRMHIDLFGDTKGT